MTEPPSLPPNEGGGAKKEPSRSPGITIEDFIYGLVEGILETQAILEATGKKFMAVADVEEDPFKRDVAETIGSIHYTSFQVLVDIQEVYRVAFLDRERLKLSYEIIDMLVPYITNNDQAKNEEILKMIHYRRIELEKRLAKLRPYERDFRRFRRKNL